MPNEESAKTEGVALTPSSETSALPPVVPPQTSAPVQFNQQVNLSIQQIPSSAWDRLSPEQVVDISKAIIAQLDATDKRHYDYAMEEIARSTSGKKVALICGCLVAIAGYGITAYACLNKASARLFVIQGKSIKQKLDPKTTQK